VAPQLRLLQHSHFHCHPHHEYVMQIQSFDQSYVVPQSLQHTRTLFHSQDIANVSPPFLNVYRMHLRYHHIPSPRYGLHRDHRALRGWGRWRLDQRR
jgi:hypothetical protein